MTAMEAAAERIYQLGRELAALEGYGDSSNELVSAVVGVRHDLRSLRIDPRVYRVRDEVALAANVVEAIEVAREDVDRKARELSDPVLPDGDDPFLRALDRIAGSDGGR